ncbi:glycoside hydrolase family 28 protein [Paenibacillus chartarius]|uniref:Glycoside hydrolase family 28 protein n=1 Tax=Paenibacillus chartarius TaxID=747481 RepID=A0ABV6DSL9_9BACL
MIVSILDYGAVGDGVTKATRSIQAAIDACAEHGGGTVLVPKGNYLSGTLLLRSNVTLHLEAEGRIVSSMEEADFTAPEGSDELELSEGQGSRALLSARHAVNIAVTGLGTIDGRGEQFLEPEDGVSDYVLLPLGQFRPKLIDFEGCTNVVFRDVTLYRASSWGLHMTGCRTVTISGIKILGQQRGPNNDGIDPDCCQDVHISNCHIETGDDCIVVKTTKYGAERYGACENITVTNCTLMSHDSAIKIGTETHADIRNITVTNCVIRNSNRGVGIWVRDGATIENMLFSNLIMETRLFSDEEEINRQLRWWGKSEPIFITAERRNGGQLPPGSIRNIRFHNIIAETEGCIYLEDSEESVIEDISIRGLRTKLRRVSGYPGGWFDTQPSARGVFAHHIPALFCKHARKVTLSDIEVVWGEDKSEHWSNAVYAEQVEDLMIRGFRGAASDAEHSVIELHRVRDVVVEGSRAERGSGVFLKLADTAAEELALLNNDLSKAASAVQAADGAPVTGYFSTGNRLSAEGGARDA